MNCASCQRLLLSLADPTSPPPEAAVHLAGCVTCREVLERLTRIEANVPRLPTPPSQRKEEVVRFFLNPSQGPVSGPVSARAGGQAGQLKPEPRGPTLLRYLKRWGAIAAAASILVAVGLWLGDWAARNFRPQGEVAKKKDKEREEEKEGPGESKKEALPEKTLAELVLECDLELAETSDARRRVEALARLAQGLRTESGWLAKTAAEKELKTLVRLHGKVMSEGLVARAKDLPRAERRKTLEPIAAELAESHAAMKTLAPKVEPALGRPLDEIALATDSAARALKELMDEATP